MLSSKSNESSIIDLSNELNSSNNLINTNFIELDELSNNNEHGCFNQLNDDQNNFKLINLNDKQDKLINSSSQSTSSKSNLTDENSNECDSLLKSDNSQINYYNRIKKKMKYKIKGEIWLIKFFK